ncbi:uncharacterized protein [Triticum aestivum]|uniref:uncharacterized protein n=1 Tax=Triticum aestivum TaxID=4565 RepID=UPI001D02F4A3|nr:uncharacterized protein LOC123076635 [Triticum aestivum]
MQRDLSRPRKRVSFSNLTRKRCQTQIPREKVELIDPVRLGTEQSPPFFSFLPNSPTRNPWRRFFFLAQRRRPDAAAPSSTSSPAPPLIVAYSAAIPSSVSAGRMDRRREKVAVAPPAPPLFAAANSSSGQSAPGLWPMYTHPPDGFLSLSGSPRTPPFQPMHYPSYVPPPQQEQQESLHFVGVPSHVAFSTPPPPQPPPPVHSKRKKKHPSLLQVEVLYKKKTHVVELEDDPEPSRCAQRLNWIQQEEKRLASAWLELSTDPIEGNGNKRDKYWDDIAVQYNSLTPADRHRDVVQLKSHFQKVKRKINIFHGAYNAMCKLYTSGYGEEQLQAFALEKYEANQQSAFQHLTMWRELKDNGKWLAAMKTMNGEQDKTDITSGAIDVEDEERPPGRDTSKDERDGKRKP